MRKLILGLRSKILGGGFVFLVPLAIALVFLYQAGTAQINTARLERGGLDATVPLFDALFDWQAAGLHGNTDTVVKDLERYETEVAARASQLSYSAEGMEAAKIPWSGPAELIA